MSRRVERRGALVEQRADVKMLFAVFLPPFYAGHCSGGYLARQHKAPPERLLAVFAAPALRPNLPWLACAPPHFQEGKAVFKGTTILCVRKDGHVCMAGDGQVTLENRIVMKKSARKVRRLAGGKVIAGFAGSTADAFTLFERFEEKLAAHQNNLARAAVELAKLWRTDRFLRKLEAILIVADQHKTLVLTGVGDVIEPDAGVIAIGSGGSYAQAAALALVEHSPLSARQIAEAAMKIAGDLCVFTNDQVVYEEF